MGEPCSESHPFVYVCKEGALCAEVQNNQKQRPILVLVELWATPVTQYGVPTGASRFVPVKCETGKMISTVEGSKLLPKRLRIQTDMWVESDFITVQGFEREN